MAIKMNTECILCHLKRNVETARALGDEQTATAFIKELMELFLKAPEETSSPALGPGTNALYEKYYGLEPDRFRKEKEESNRFVMERMDKVYSCVNRAEDKILSALQFAILGNYIDFSALFGQVSFEKLDKMLERAGELELDRQTYEKFLGELSEGKKLLYLTDNAGEICFDRILAEKLAEAYPQLQITFCVRGGPAHNDATREDAVLAGIPFSVIDNGNNVGGTELSLLSDEARRALEEADVILAKGQGNTETLYGSGYNIYYAFMVKCGRFEEVFQRPKMTPMLVSERK